MPHLEPVSEPRAVEQAIDAVLVLAGLDPRARPAAAAVDREGTARYLLREGDDWLVEEVAGGVVGASLALDHLPGGEAVIAAVIEAREAPAPPIAALSESPPDEVEGEGDLTVFRRRSPDLWRARPVASRALAPSAAADEGGAVHLVFLQPSADGLFVVVYALIDGARLVREEVGRRALGIAPHVVLVDGGLVVTFVSDLGGPVVLQARAVPGGPFREAEVLPEVVLGEPRAAPASLAWLEDASGGSLAVVRPVAGSRLELARGRRVRLDARASQALLVSTFELGELTVQRVLGTGEGRPGASRLALGGGALLEAAIVRAGGVPLLTAPQSEARRVRGGAGPEPGPPRADLPRVWVGGGLD